MKIIYKLKGKFLKLFPPKALKYKSVLIVTYGRTGSTLLQGLLNSIDGCLVRGENNQFCYDLFNAYQHILEIKQKYAPLPTSPFYGAHLLEEEKFIKYTQNMVKDLLLADKKENEVVCYGFKEVRYISVLEHFSEYLEFLNKIFPKVAIVLLTRKIEDTLKSGWWPDRDPEETVRNMEKCDLLFKNYEKNHANGFLITYDDLVNKTPKLRDLFDFLGAKYSENTVNQILAKPHSYSGK